MSERGMHIGRSFGTGRHLEVDCPCDKGPCGLAVADSAPDCPQHGMQATKTIRQMHWADECPGASA